MSHQPQYTKAIVEARAGVVPTLALAVMAGAFIGLGGALTGTIAVGSELGIGPTRLLMGLFSRYISLRALGRNWALVYVGNLAGALIVVLMVYYGRWWMQGDFSFAGSAVATADAKVNLSFETAFVRGILANILVCLAIWLAMAGHTVTDKLLGIVLPVTTFIAAGFEHSIANMYFVPLGLMISTEPEALAAAGLTADQLDRLNVPWAVHNLVAVSLGNIIGGGVMVALAHWFIHLRRQPASGDQPPPQRPDREG